MRNHRRYALISPALVLVVTFAAPTVEAGVGFGMHLGSGGFGVSVGFGDWGVYTRSWSDPYWSVNFNAALSGYGEWVWVNGLGRVWRPWVATSWRPYTYGRWVSTGYGLTWVAYEPWGYFPHHYGNWAYASFGWVWVPGYSYSCANVVWVGSGGYVGWYARPPHGWSHAHHGFHHGYRHGFDDGYRSGYSDGWHDARYATYVDWRHVGADNVSRHAVSHRIASQSRIEGRAGAPNRDEIRRRGGGAITETHLSRRSVRVDGREVTIARPDGVAPSIERNAAETVGRSLSEEALKRRQPQVRPRTSRSSSASGSSRPAGVSRDARAPQVRRSSPEASSSRSDRSKDSRRSSSTRSTRSHTEGVRTSTDVFVPISDSRREGGESHRLSPRASGATGATERHRSERAPSASTGARSSTATRQLSPEPRKTTGSQRSQDRVRQPSATSRQVAPTKQQASELRRPQSHKERSTAARSKKDSEEKSSKEPSRKRRR